MNPLPAPSSRRLPIPAADLLLVLIVSLGAVRLLGALVIVAFGLTDPGVDHSSGQILAATVILLVVRTIAVLVALHTFVIRKHGLRWADLGLRRAEGKWYGQALAIAVMLVPAVALINYAVGQIEGQPFENPQIYAIAPGGFSWSGLITMILVAGVVAPFSEELALRGLFFAWLDERVGLALAVAISALTFASLHGVLQLIPALAVVGAALALFYRRCGSLWPVVVAHGAFNAIMVVTLYSALAGTTTAP